VTAPTVSHDQLVSIAQDGDVTVKPANNLYDFEHHRPIWTKHAIICVLCLREWVGACPVNVGSWWECPDCHALAGQTIEVLSDQNEQGTHRGYNGVWCVSRTTYPPRNLKGQSGTRAEGLEADASLPTLNLFFRFGPDTASSLPTINASVQSSRKKEP